VRKRIALRLTGTIHPIRYRVRDKPSRFGRFWSPTRKFCTILPSFTNHPTGPIPCLKNTSEGDILTIREVAEYLKVTERTIYRLASAKKIPAFKVGGTWRFRATDIDGWIADQSKRAEGAD
jgi:excisionase family DNA binding protein